MLITGETERIERMAGKSKKKGLAPRDSIQLDKIKVFFRRPVLKAILKLLVMESSMYRTWKSLKSINKLFSNLDESRYKNAPDSVDLIWCIAFLSKKWLDGYTELEIILEGAKRQPEWDPTKEQMIQSCIDDKHVIPPQEARTLLELVAEALRYGYIVSMREEYISLLEEIDLEDPQAFRELTDRLFLVSQSLMDIKHNTNVVTNKVEFNTGDLDSIHAGLTATIESLSESNAILKIGIKRWNTLLSPGYMNGRLYVYLGTPAAGKSIVLLKTALDIRKYNPGFHKDSTDRQCVLYISMENSFTETIERIWLMCFDDPITNYTEEEAFEKLTDVLGVKRIIKDDVVAYDVDKPDEPLEAMLLSEEKEEEPNIELVIQYYPYKSISTDDLWTIIQDLEDEHYHVISLVFDYIKRIEPAVPVKDNLRLELDHIMNELKALAVMKNIPVITAHQMNRASATVIDTATRQGKADVSKLAGRDGVGDSWSVMEVADWVGILNAEYRPGTNEKYETLNVVKRRRIDSKDQDFAQFTYLAHPFARGNGLRLVDDLYLDKVLSLRSLLSDIDTVGKEKINATPRLRLMEDSDFIED